jgi:hypothetical protein
MSRSEKGFFDNRGMQTPCYDRRILPPFLHELARRNRSFYPESGWHAALAVADQEAPRTEPPPPREADPGPEPDR